MYVKTTGILCLMMAIGGCAGLDSLSPNTDRGYLATQEFSERKREEKAELDSKYRGASKNEILDLLGEPVAIDKDREYSYLVDTDCFGPSCDIAYAEERWRYSLKDKGVDGWYAYSLYVLFNGEMVVKIY